MTELWRGNIGHLVQRLICFASQLFAGTRVSSLRLMGSPLRRWLRSHGSVGLRRFHTGDFIASNLVRGLIPSDSSLGLPFQAPGVLVKSLLLGAPPPPLLSFQKTSQNQKKTATIQGFGKDGWRRLESQIIVGFCWGLGGDGRVPGPCFPCFCLREGNESCRP